MAWSLWFAPAHDWTATTTLACELATGRALDIGAGAGRVTLMLQEQGYDVVALDVSAGATAVCRERGVRRTVTGDVFDLAAAHPEPFDTYLMLGNNLGLLAGVDEAPRFLEALAGMARPGARIIGETVDPYRTTDPVHLGYHEQNRRLGRLAGQLRLRIRHLHLATPWWEYLLCTPEELESIVSPTRWMLRDVYSADAMDPEHLGRWFGGQWVAVLALGD